MPEGVGFPMPAGIPDHDETIDYYERATGHKLRDLDYYEILAGTRPAILGPRRAHDDRSKNDAAGLPDGPKQSGKPVRREAP